MSAASLNMSMPNVSRLSERVIRIMGLNPAPFTLNGSCTYLVGTGARRCLIDTGGGVPGWLDSVQSALSLPANQEIPTTASSTTAPLAEISLMLLTHSHSDHVGGIEGIKSLFPKAEVWKLPSPYRPHADEAIRGLKLLRGGERFELEGNTTLNVIATPGHCDDHAVFHLEEENALFTGDTVLGVGTTVFVCYADYMRSLATLRDRNAALIYPGHGPVVKDAKGKLEEYITHRGKREQQILGVLQQAASTSGSSGSSSEGVTAMDIVKLIYTDTPKEVYFGAALNVSHHLRKLFSEGIISPAPQSDDAAKNLLSEPEYLMDKGEEKMPEKSYIEKVIGIRWRLKTVSSSL
jgi:ribonuclease/clavin/mitogillin